MTKLRELYIAIHSYYGQIYCSITSIHYVQSTINIPKTLNSNVGSGPFFVFSVCHSVRIFFVLKELTMNV